MNINKARQLLNRYLRDKSNPEEEIVIEQWYRKLLDTGKVSLSAEELVAKKNQMEARLMDAIKVDSPAPVFTLSRIMWAAASLILIFSLALFTYNKFNRIEPGRDMAILTLSDGSKIELAENSAGELAGEDGISIHRKKSGWLEYIGNSKKSGNNTLSIPRGGQYRLILSDGTRVWVNSETTLIYPTVFNGKTRKISLKGEAFFEVKHDTAHPFIVEVNGIDITVLGTSFNITAYPRENVVNTTVATGLVGVSSKAETVFVKPGQQAVYHSGQKIKTQAADLEEVLAWKEGLFRFNGLKLSAITQQLSRWYNVEFEFRGKVPDQELYGIIPRTEELSHVIEILEAAGNLNFEISGRKIIVSTSKK